MEFEVDADPPEASSLLSLQSLPLSLPRKSYNCPISDCSLVFPSKKEVNGHKVAVHGFVQCSARRCGKIFMSERKREIHLEKCHREVREDKPAPTVLAVAQTPAKLDLEHSLIGDLQETTLDYLSSVKRLSNSEGSFNAQRFQSLATYILNELVGGMSVGTQSFLLHALDVAMGMPAVEKKGESCQTVLGDMMEIEKDSQEDSAGFRGISRSSQPFKKQSSSQNPDKHSSSPKRRGPKPSTNVCVKCNQLFSFKKDLLAHRHLVHPGRKPAPFSVQQLPLATPALPVHPCSEPGCEKSFRTETGLSCHFLEKHSS